MRLMKRLTMIAAATALAFCALSTSHVAAQSQAPKETVVPNVLPGLSYIRLRLAGLNTTYDVKVNGTESGQLYNQFSLQPPGTSVIQLNPTDLIPANTQVRPEDTTMLVTIGGKRAGMTGVAGSYQHVRFNAQNRTLENMSECSFNRTAMDAGYYDSTFTGAGAWLSNVHTSKLNGYTSYINITNPDDVPRKFSIEATDTVSRAALNATPATGSGKTPNLFEYEITVPARGSRRVSFPALETAKGFAPTNAQLQVNVTVSPTYDPNAPNSGYSTTAIITHTVLDQQSMAETNLSQYCPIEGVSITTNPLKGGNYPPTRQATSNSYTLSDGSTLTIDCKNEGSEVLPEEKVGQACQITDWPANTSTPGTVRGNSGPNGGVGSGAAADGQLYPAGDVDWYKVRLEKGVAYVIFADPKPTTRNSDPSVPNDALFKSTLKVKDDQGRDFGVQQWEGLRSSSRGGSGYFLLTSPVTKDYFVEVSALDGASTGGYQLVVNSIFKADPCAPTNPQDFARAENWCNTSGGDFAANDTTQGQLCINCETPGSSALIPATDKDWHKVDLVAGTTYIFDVTRVGTGGLANEDERGLGKPKISLLNASGTVLASVVGNYPTELELQTYLAAHLNCQALGLACVKPPTPLQVVPAQITFTATSTGFHYIEVASADGISSGGYQIRVRR